MTYLDPLSVEGLALLDVLRLAQRLGVGVVRKTTLVCAARKGDSRKSSQEADERGGVHLDDMD